MDRVSDTARTLRAKMSLDATRTEARHEILQAMRLENGNAVRAAKLLGIGHRTLLRYLEDTVIKAGVEEIRGKAAKARAGAAAR